MLNLKFNIGDKVHFIGLKQLGIVVEIKLFDGNIYDYKTDDTYIYGVKWSNTDKVEFYTDEEIEKEE
jgi:hypothetical protein